MCRYLARRHTVSDFMPLAVAGLFTFNSSPVTLMARLESVPTWFGNMPPVYFTVRVLLASSTAQVPYVAVVACTAAVFSSGVPLRRLLILNLGTSEFQMI